MNAFLSFAFPGGIALAGMLAILAGVAASLLWPRPLLLGFICCMLVIASSSGYGFEDPRDANVFWVKGSRTFFFTFIEMGLVTAWLTALFRMAWDRLPGEPLPTTKYYIGLWLLLLGHFLAGLFDPTHASIRDWSQRGFSNLLLQGMFIAMVVATLRKPQDLSLLLKLMLLCLAARHLFGLVRYAGFGGDPQNAYATLGSSAVKITFWDVNDAVLAAVMFALCAWRLLVDAARSTGEKFFYAGGALLAMLMPLLSARRTGQGGLLIAAAALILLLPRGRRWPMLLALALAVPLALGALSQRNASAQGGLLERVFIDVKRDPMSDPRRTRFHELKTAWQTIKETPLIGVGPSGSFKVYDRIGLEYHGGRYDYVHSGFGHMLLKGGVVGLLLFAGLLLAWTRHVVRHWKNLSGDGLALSVGAVAGLAALAPTLMFGTPVTEIRTMLVMGLLMVIPILAIRIGPQPEKADAPVAVRRRPVRPWGLVGSTGWRETGSR